MKKIITITMFAFILFYANQANAKIRRVGYPGTPVPTTDYINLTMAQDSAAVGDTILLFPGSWSATLSKKLVILGYGYFVTGTGANANLQNMTGASDVRITLDSTSAGTILEGIGGLVIQNQYNHSVKNITIRRCNGTVYGNNQTYDNWQILQCYLTQFTPSSTIKIINIKVDNSYIGNCSFDEASGSTGQFNNNIFAFADFANGLFLIKNSIFINQHRNDANCIYQNSIGTSDIYPIPAGNGNKNITSADMNTNVFVGYNDQSTYSNDGRFVLKAGSPAKGAGAGGTDAGIFGGTNPYKLSGIPRIPSFYKLSATSNITSTNPYTITFSVRSNN